MKGLSVRNIYKEYENKPLLSGISVDALPGETVCLLGASGSGKSTLLRIIAGLEKPEAGSIFWDDVDITRVPTHQRKFGFMFQDYALFPHMTVEKNIGFGMEEQSYAKVNEILERFKLGGYGQRKVTDLSGGEQQRVALARTLASSPRLLLLDEPLAALDRGLRKQLLQEIREALHETGTPAIYVTHDQEEAFSIADRVLILEGGVFLQNGTPEEVYLHPASLAVAHFFGQTNELAGRIIEVRPAIIVESGIGKFQPGGDAAVGNEIQIGRIVHLLLREARVVEVIGKPGAVNTLSAVVKDVQFSEDGYRTTMFAGDIQMVFMFDVSHPIGEMLQLVIDPADISMIKEQTFIVED